MMKKYLINLLFISPDLEKLQNISFGNIGSITAPEVLGTAGFSGINIDNSSFIAISAH